MRQVFEYHPTVGYRFIPGLRARLENETGGYLLRVNQQGFRSEREFQEKKADASFRVLLFGDSFTAGDSVSNRERYSDVLEELVTGLEVYNFGLSGTGTDQQYLTWREMGNAYEHDLLVIAVLVENIRRVVARYRPYDDGSGRHRLFAKPYFDLGPNDALELRHVPVPRDPIDEDALSVADRSHVDRGGNLALLRATANALGGRVKEGLQRLTRYQPLPAYEDPRSNDWRLLRAILKRWTSESKVPTLVVPVPLYQYIEETADPLGYRARFAELVEWPHVTVHDPLADFRRASKAERRSYRFERDVHLTPAGHRILARSLAPIIERLRARPQGQPQP
jgi:hypothetical protein